MTDIIVGAIILVIIVAAILKIISEKRKGAKCVGCPYSTSNTNCNCNTSNK